jgi:DNA-directed RNA polymerase specialized sigma24 family protein
MPLGASDETLLQASANGDQRAFAELYERHARTIYNYLFRRLADWSEAEDLTAVVFLEAFRRRVEVVVVEGKLVPWPYGIATNVLRTRRRARGSRRADAFGLEADRQLAAPAAGCHRPLHLVRAQLQAVGAGGLAWSPDGRRVAFVSNRGGSYGLYVMNADASGQRSVTQRAE